MVSALSSMTLVLSNTLLLEQQTPSASVSAISDSGNSNLRLSTRNAQPLDGCLDAVADPSSSARSNKSASDLLSLAHLSSSQTPLSSMSTINAQTLPTGSQVRTRFFRLSALDLSLCFLVFEQYQQCVVSLSKIDASHCVNIDAIQSLSTK